jgi:lysophospholipase L1-like esterase
MRNAIIAIFLATSSLCFGQCTPPNINVYIAAHGDSITVGADSPDYPYLTDLSALVASSSVSVTTLNGGTSGISWNYTWYPNVTNPNTMIQEAATLIDPVLALTGYKTKWLILFAGTNGMNLSLGNHSPQTEYANFQQYMAARVNAGWDMTHTVVCTMLPRGSGEEASRVAYNALLVSDTPQFKYRLARFDLDPTMGQAGQNSNTTYYLDGTHPTNLGQTILAGILFTAMYGNTGSPQNNCGATIMGGAAILHGVLK